jgi:predicted phage terminase large subunit-like protein
MRSIRIIVQQRTHVDDLSGYVLAQSTWAPDNRAGWAWLCVPMEFGKGPRSAPEVSPFGWKDWRAEFGEVLQADRFPARVLADKKRKLGTFSYEGQYNQNPEALDGGMMRRHWWGWFRLHDLDVSAAWHRPYGTKEDPAVILAAHKTRAGEYDLDWLTITVDSTFGSTTDTASAVGLLVVGGRKLLKYVFDDQTEVRTFLQTVAAIKALIRRYYARRVLIELKANGTSVIEQLKKEMADGTVIGPNGKPCIIAVEGMEPGKDSKMARAQAMTPDIENGFIHLLEGAPWVDAFLAELCVFPRSKRDDRVDALSQLVRHYAPDTDAANRSRALARW